MLHLDHNQLNNFKIWWPKLIDAAKKNKFELISGALITKKILSPHCAQFFAKDVCKKYYLKHKGKFGLYCTLYLFLQLNNKFSFFIKIFM